MAARRGGGLGHMTQRRGPPPPLPSLLPSPPPLRRLLDKQVRHSGASSMRLVISCASLAACFQSVISLSKISDGVAASITDPFHLLLPPPSPPPSLSPLPVLMLEVEVRCQGHPQSGEGGKGGGGVTQIPPPPPLTTRLPSTLNLCDSSSSFTEGELFVTLPQPPPTPPRPLPPPLPPSHLATPSLPLSFHLLSPHRNATPLHTR